MAEFDPALHLSPLAQSVTRDGKTVQVDIYRDGEGGWLLEVVDDCGNSTVCNDPCPCGSGKKRKKCCGRTMLQ